MNLVASLVVPKKLPPTVSELNATDADESTGPAKADLDWFWHLVGAGAHDVPHVRIRTGCFRRVHVTLHVPDREVERSATGTGKQQRLADHAAARFGSIERLIRQNLVRLRVLQPGAPLVVTVRRSAGVAGMQTTIEIFEE